MVGGLGHPGLRPSRQAQDTVVELYTQNEASVWARSQGLRWRVAEMATRRDKISCAVSTLVQDVHGVDSSKF